MKSGERLAFSLDLVFKEVKVIWTGHYFISKLKQVYSPAGIYLFKVNNGNTRTMFEICSKLTIKTPERRQLRRSGVFIVNFEQI